MSSENVNRSCSSSNKVNSKVANLTVFKTPVFKTPFPINCLQQKVFSSSGCALQKFPLINLANTLKEPLIKRMDANKLLHIRSFVPLQSGLCEKRHLSEHSTAHKKDKSTQCSPAKIMCNNLRQQQPSKSKIYTDDEILSALRVRIMCKTRPYSYIVKAFPNLHLPTSDTINKRIRHLQAHSGIQHEVLGYLSELKDSLRKDCVLIIDEVAFEEKIEFSTHLKQVTGVPTLPPRNKEEHAKHMLVIQVCGLVIPYKFNIAWELTAVTCEAKALNDLIDSCVNSLRDAGLHVRAITSDMGALNIGIWNLNGIDADRLINPHPSSVSKPMLTGHCFTKFCTEFPGLDDPIYFFADPTHLFKLLRNELITHDLHLPDWVKDSWHIEKGGCIVSWRFIQKLYDIQENSMYRIAYKITPSHLNPSSFEKMRVNFAYHIFSEETAAAIKTCIAGKLLPEEALATAIFCEQTCRWFKLMNNRVPILALRKNHEEDNNKTFSFLL